MTPPRFCFSFVCQSGPLEAKAVLLAASLRRHLPPAVEADLVAAVPGPQARFGRLASATLTALERLEVRRVPIHNPLDPDYLIGHKLDALAVPTRAPVTVLLDSDVLMLRAPGAHELAALEADVAAVPASLAHADADDWRSIYRRCGLPLPETRVQLLQSGAPSLPYYNSGVVASRAAKRLADAWTDAAMRIDGHPRLRLSVRRPWLDKLALPVAAQALGWTVTRLEADWNFPSWAWQLPRGRLPLLYHYQQPERFLQEWRVHAQARALAWDDPAVTAALADDPWFRPVLAHGWLTRKLARRIARHLRPAAAEAA